MKHSYMQPTVTAVSLLAEDIITVSWKISDTIPKIGEEADIVDFEKI